MNEINKLIAQLTEAIKGRGSQTCLTLSIPQARLVSNSLIAWDEVKEDIKSNGYNFLDYRFCDGGEIVITVEQAIEIINNHLMDVTNLNLSREKTFPETLEEVKVEMCDDYCKYPEQLSEEELNDKCEECPLGRLG